MAAHGKDAEEIASVAAALPSGRAALLDLAAQTVEALHACVLACDEQGANTAIDRYAAIVWKLHGNKFIGCMDSGDPQAGGILADKHCCAEPGKVPMWGQSGEFLITVQGIRARVVISDGFGRMSVNMAFHVIDHDAPFISETGYRSHFDKMRGGCTVDEVAKGVFAAFLQKERTPLGPQYRQRRAEEQRPTWLAVLPELDAAERVFQDCAGQMAFGF